MVLKILLFMLPIIRSTSVVHAVIVYKRPYSLSIVLYFGFSSSAAWFALCTARFHFECGAALLFTRRGSALFATRFCFMRGAVILCMRRGFTLRSMQSYLKFSHKTALRTSSPRPVRSQMMAICQLAAGDFGRCETGRVLGARVCCWGGCEKLKRLILRRILRAEVCDRW